MHFMCVITPTAFSILLKELQRFKTNELCTLLPSRAASLRTHGSRMQSLLCTLETTPNSKLWFFCSFTRIDFCTFWVAFFFLFLLFQFVFFLRFQLLVVVRSWQKEEHGFQAAWMDNQSSTRPSQSLCHPPTQGHGVRRKMSLDLSLMAWSLSKKLS